MGARLLLHIVGDRTVDQMLLADEPSTTALPAASPALESEVAPVPQPVTDAPIEQPTVTPPVVDALTFSGRRVKVNPIDVYKRFPAYEHIAQTMGLNVAGVWGAIRENVDGLGGIALLRKGQPAHIYLFAPAAITCRVKRYFIAQHEIEHVRIASNHVYEAIMSGNGSPDSERACDREAEKRTRAFLETARPIFRTAVDVDRCARCAVSREDACPQGDDVFADLNSMWTQF